MGELEIWEFDNRTPSAHPIHLHADHFQVLDRKRRSTGQQIPLRADELGWEDTVIVGAGEIVRVMVKFEQFSGKFVWHCHMLEHEDLEMMRPLVILPRPVPEPATGVLLVAASMAAALRRRQCR